MAANMHTKMGDVWLRALASPSSRREMAQIYDKAPTAPRMPRKASKLIRLPNVRGRKPIAVMMRRMKKPTPVRKKAHSNGLTVAVQNFNSTELMPKVRPAAHMSKMARRGLSALGAGTVWRSCGAWINA